MEKGKRGKVYGLLIACVVFIATNGCRERQAESILPETTPVESTRTIQDDLGRRVTIPLKIERAVSLAPNLTEMIFAAGAGDRLVGVTTYCNYPPEAQSIQKVSDTQTPNIENIIALKPQIVFVSTASQLEAFTGILDQQNISVFITSPTSFAGVLKNLKQIGDILGTSEIAARVVGGLQRRVDAVKDRVSGRPPVRIFMQFSREPLFTIGKESFLTEVIELAGGESVTKDVATAYPKLSKETALALNPDAIILSDSEDNREPNDVFKTSPAVKNGFVYRIDADIISRPGPRLIDALEQISSLLHK